MIIWVTRRITQKYLALTPCTEPMLCVSYPSYRNPYHDNFVILREALEKQKEGEKKGGGGSCASANTISWDANQVITDTTHTQIYTLQPFRVTADFRLL